MKYDEMSDVQINHEVTKVLLGLSDSDYSERDVAYVRCGSIFTVANYCNNPSDVWGLIIMNGISINKWNIHDNTWTADVEHPRATSDYNTIEVEHRNPLRAACICFLLMKEAENA